MVEITSNGSVMLRSIVGKVDQDWKPVVLLVDDNHVNRKVLSSWLNKKKYEWRQATDGLEAVEIFKEHPPNFFNVILMDLSMPRMNGYDAAQEIRKIETLRNGNEGSSKGSNQRARIFAVTGLASSEDKRKAFACGMDGYLVKPVAFGTVEDLFIRFKTG